MKLMLDMWYEAWDRGKARPAAYGTAPSSAAGPPARHGGAPEHRNRKLTAGAADLSRARYLEWSPR